MAKQTADIISAPKAQAPQQDPNLPLTGSRIFLLNNDKRKGTVSVDVEEDVIDPNTGRTRRMRLLRGAQSIWFDEQPPTVFPASYVNKNTLSLKFNRGKCIISNQEKLKLQAAELSNRNTDNPRKYGAKDIYFHEWNPIKQNEKAMKEENEIIQAMQFAFSAKYEDMVPHAKYLNIQFHDEQGVPFDETAIRAAYIKKAKNDAGRFMKSYNSPIVATANLVRRGIEEGHIDLGKQVGAAFWTDGGFISVLPQGRDHVEYLVEFAMGFSEESKAFINQLKQLLNTE